MKSINVPIVRMPSAGEFLGRRNATLLIGISQYKKEQVIKTLHESVQERVAVRQPSDEQTAPEEITIGATLFSFEIERYEEF